MGQHVHPFGAGEKKQFRRAKSLFWSSKIPFLLSKGKVFGEKKEEERAINYFRKRDKLRDTIYIWQMTTLLLLLFLLVL